MRSLIRERLGDLPLLSQSPALRRRRRQRASTLLQQQRLLTGAKAGAEGYGAAAAAGDADSTVSGATHTLPGLLMRQASRSPSGVGLQGSFPAVSSGLQPQGSFRAGSLASLSLAGGGAGLRSMMMAQPDHVKLPDEYDKVRELSLDGHTSPVVDGEGAGQGAVK